MNHERKTSFPIGNQYPSLTTIIVSCGRIRQR